MLSLVFLPYLLLSLTLYVSAIEMLALFLSSTDLVLKVCSKRWSLTTSLFKRSFDLVFSPECLSPVPAGKSMD